MKDYVLNETTASTDVRKIKMGRAKRPVQELRLTSGSSPCDDLRSLADRFLRTADPQVLICYN